MDSNSLSFLLYPSWRLAQEFQFTCCCSGLGSPTQNGHIDAPTLIHRLDAVLLVIQEQFLWWDGVVLSALCPFLFFNFYNKIAVLQPVAIGRMQRWLSPDWIPTPCITPTTPTLRNKMPFPLKRVSEPATEPVTLDDMKNYLRVDFPDDDALINGLISAARERAEDVTGRCLISQQWQFSFDRFPNHSWHGGYYHGGYNHGLHRNSMFKSDGLEVTLPRGPVISVDSITYKDQTGATQTLSPSAYNVDLLSQPARIVPVYNTVWPLALHDTNSVTITFTAGYATVPNSFIHAIKLIVGAYYENRAEVVQSGGNFNQFPMPLSAQALLGTYTMMPLGYPRD